MKTLEVPTRLGKFNTPIFYEKNGLAITGRIIRKTQGILEIQDDVYNITHIASGHAIVVEPMDIEDAKERLQSLLNLCNWSLKKIDIKKKILKNEGLKKELESIIFT